MKEVLDGLSYTMKKTLPYFELSEEELSKSYGIGKWTVRQLLHHITDAETVLYERIRRGIAHPGQVVYGFHQDDWVNNLDYDTRPMEVSKNIYTAVRTGIIHLTTQFYQSSENYQYVHSETGLRTVKEEFDKVVWHNAHHLGQIEKALS